METKSCVFLLFFLTSTIMAQKVDYYPKQNPNVSNENYRYGTTILDETYKQIKKNNGVLHYVNYWNLAIAYMTLKVDHVEDVKFFLEKSKQLNPANFSELFLDSSNGKNVWNGFISDAEFNDLYASSLEYVKKGKDEKKLNLTVESKNKSNALTNLIDEIESRDVKYRQYGSRDDVKQKELDKINVDLVDSLINKYGKYIGKSYVGKEKMHVMWSVIQHSDLSFMEKYLPVVHEAVLKDELELSCLKLLVDRIYDAKYNYQIFGTQISVPLGPIEVVNKIREKYLFDIQADKPIINQNKFSKSSFPEKTSVVK